MTPAAAKKIPIATLLKVATPPNNKGEVWIKSPFSPNEKTPSFKINTFKNIWYDHAQGVGGTIIDLVMQLHNLSTSDALRHLANSDNFSFSPAPSLAALQKKEESQNQTITKIQPLQNPALLEYLQGRKIDLKIATLYLEEIYYTYNKKNYFALAFKSDAGGYELRNTHFKGCHGSKAITTIKSPTPTKKVSIFEGFIDFLSALTYFKKTHFSNDVIVLNSVSNIKTININQCETVYLFLDNDNAGNATKQALYAQNSNCIDCSNIYKNCKDFNDFLMI